jgi:hypothetical protein
VDRSERPIPEFDRTLTIEEAVNEYIFSDLKTLVSRIPHEGNDYCSKANTGWWPIDPQLDAKDQVTRCLVEEVARELLPYVSEPYLQEDGQRVAPVLVGAEWWCRLTYCREEHEWHFDKSEILWETEGLFRHPYYGSVLYMDDKGGATVVVDQRVITKMRDPDKEAQVWVDLEDPGAKIVAEQEEVVGMDPVLEETGEARAKLTEPKRNRFLRFPGWARHGVLPTEDDGSRRTVLFNWWCWKPPGLTSEPTYLPGETRG